MTDRPRAPRPPRGPARGGSRGGPRRHSDGPTPHDPARDRAYRRVAKQARRYPEKLLITPLGDENLSPRDASFAHALYDTTMRRWITLEYLVQQGLKRDFDSLDPHVRAALLCGAAQMLLLNTVPPRAAINESVRWTKRVTRAAAPGGFVNAGLRRVSELIGEPPTPEPDPSEEGVLESTPQNTAEQAENEPQHRWPPRRERYEHGRDELPLADGRATPLTSLILPEDSVQRLAVATGHPIELLRLWAKSMPLREVRALALHGIVRPPLILNTAHAKTELPDSLTRPHTAPGHHVFTGSHAELLRLLERRSDIWVQDPASSLAVESVTDLEPKLVIDACAGQGTKTRQLAETFPEAQIVATDIDHKRRVALSEAFNTGPHAERVNVIDHRELEQWAGKGDLVLLDVPCSNTGVLARRIEARYRATEANVTSLLSMQRQIVADAVKLLAPGGAILYSTCSLDPRENEEIVDWAERWHSFESSRAARRMPAGGPGEPAENYTDGSFAALLR